MPKIDDGYETIAEVRENEGHVISVKRLSYSVSEAVIVQPIHENLLAGQLYNNMRIRA